MRYQDFAKAIGLMRENETWQPWHRHQVGEILYLAAAAEHQGPVTNPLAFGVVVGVDGEPGQGFYKNAKIVVSE